jgi:hypothetical protein
MTTASAAGYGMAGCGLGSLAFKDQPGMIQIVAATLNGIYGNQTFGITSGTSNCAEDGVSVAEKEKEYFSEANFESLNVEMAQGSGETLEAFAHIMGCEGEGVQAFSQLTQAKYSEIYPDPATTPEQMLGNLNHVMSEDASLATSCQDKG